MAFVVTRCPGQACSPDSNLVFQQKRENILVEEEAGNSNESATVRVLTCHWDGKTAAVDTSFSCS